MVPPSVLKQDGKKIPGLENRATYSSKLSMSQLKYNFFFSSPSQLGAKVVASKGPAHSM